MAAEKFKTNHEIAGARWTIAQARLRAYWMQEEKENEQVRAEEPTLMERARQAPITSLLIAVNVLVFLAVSFQGDTMEPGTLLAFGAAERTLVLSGEWWRLGASMFLHFGFVHLLLNSWAGFGWCAEVESRVGKLRFLAVYLAAGIGGAAASTIY